jgi:hypothetical protein
MNGVKRVNRRLSMIHISTISLVEMIINRYECVQSEKIDTIGSTD